MLTADLVRARVRGPTLAPVRADPNDDDVRELARRIHEGVTAGVAGQIRQGELIADLEEAIRDLGPPKVGRGLLRIAQDKLATAAPSTSFGETDPRELRFEVFQRAVARGPLGGPGDPFGRPSATDVLAEVGAERALTADQLGEALYADLPSERRLEAFDVPDPEWLIHRYNVALVQALLGSSTGITVELRNPSTPRMRQLVRWIKFHQLLHAADRDDERLRIKLDGPVSVFGPSTRYGQQLARFFPALLLQPGPWRLEATVLWTRARVKKQLVVTDADGFVSHYRDTGAYRTKTHDQFVAQFADKPRGWTLSDGALPIAVGDRGIVFPDFTLRDDEGREVHIEVLGYWRPEALRERVELLARHGPANLVLAVSKKLRGERAGEVPDHPRVVPYADVLSVAKVLEAAAQVHAGPAR